MAKITVIIQTYNRKEMLKRAIKSVLAQSFKDFELCILNNGSTDGTEDVVKKYCEKDDRIFSVKLSNNFIGIELAEKINEILKKSPDIKYCTFLDDDDFFDKNALARLYSLINENDADIATIGSRFLYSDGTLANKYVYEGVYCLNRVEAMFELLKREKINSARGGKIYKKELLFDIEYPDKRKIRDIHREYRVINNIKKMVICGEPLFYFARHDSNSSGLATAQQITVKRMEEHLQANRTRTVWLSEKMPEIAEFAFYCELSFMLSLYERIYNLNVEDCYTIAEEMKIYILEEVHKIKSEDYFTVKEQQVLQKMKGKNNE